MVKLRWACTRSWGSTGEQEQPTSSKTSVSVPVVGTTQVVDITADNIPCSALLDTGSQVCTVAAWFAQKHLLFSDFTTVEQLIDLRQVDGQQVDYHGVIPVDLKFPELISEQTFTVPVLVMKDTAFSHDVPFLIGTNVLSSCLHVLQQEKGTNFVQKLHVSTPWKVAFQCLQMQEKRSLGKLDEVYSTKAVEVAPLSSVTVSGITRAHTPGKTLTITESNVLHVLPAGLVVQPSLQEVDFSTGMKNRIHVTIQNLTRHPVTIPNKSVLCNLQKASIVDPSDVDSAQDSAQSGPFLDMFKFSDNIAPDELKQLQDLLHKWQHLFSCSDTDLGRTDVMKHRIVLTNNEPFRERYRRIPPQLYQEVKDHLRDMLKAKVIRESQSPFASPVVLVRKADGTLRFCVDYRTLNSRTVRDAFTLPRIDDTIDSLAGCRYFSSLDLKFGYWQQEISEEDREKTAFTVGPLGFFEFETLAFGLVNAPASFQRLMQTVMGDLHLKECWLYLDDIIVASKTFSEHLDRLNNVFQRLADAGLKLKPSKCNFFQEEIKYLGHLISKEGIRTDSSKIETLRKWPVPRCIQDVRRFLGFAGFYRRFCPGFSQIARPLHNLLKGDGSTHRKHKKPVPTPSQPFQWTEEHQSAFNQLIDLLSSSPVLAFADFSLPFILHTDASFDGISGILYQEQNGEKRPIAFASRGLTPAESRYPAHKLEFLALKWSVTDKFKEYLYGSHFTVFTDNNPLTYILSTAKLDATGQRWIAELANYDFSIQYRSGKHNIDADALSRIPRAIQDQERGEDQHIPPDVVKAICESRVNTPAIISTMCLTAEPTQLMNISSSPLFCRKQDIVSAQSQDSDLQPFLLYLKDGTKPQKSKLNAEQLVLFRVLDSLMLRDNILFRRRINNGEQQYQLVVPTKLRHIALTGIHDNVGHLGRNRSLQLAQDRFSGPG